MTDMLLLDTNVWLDAFLPNRVRTEEAKALLAEAQRKGIQLLYPVHIVPDVFYLSCIAIKQALVAQHPDKEELCAQAARTTAWEYVNAMQELGCAVGADASDVRLASLQEHLHGDMEDDLVIAAAQRSKAKALVTSDAALARHAPVPTFSLTDALAYLSTL